ncbi:MAG: hypothetical protein NVSMB68_11170 [Thermoanaerobaculia bacterium]
MNRTLHAVLAVFLTFVLTSAISSATASGPQATDLSPQFRSAGLAIARFHAFEVGGVVILRGVARDHATAEEAGRVAVRLGYTRVANLVKVASPPDDAAIERLAERALSLHRSLDGCTFHVNSERGVLTVAGVVGRDLQKDLALEVLRNIDGVTEVRMQLRRR